MPTGAPTAVTVTTKTIDVHGMGTVFNVADDYFNDGLVPPTPIANFGTQSQITAVVHDDGSLDVAWLDYATGKGQPWALPSPGVIYLTHIDPTLGTAPTKSSGITSYRLLGFTMDAAGSAYIAYNKDHPFKTSTAGDANNTNGNELHVTKLSGGSPAWDQLVFGDGDNNLDGSLGEPGAAASSVLGYDSTNQKLVIYCGHSMMWAPERHQAGYFRLLDPNTGMVLPPTDNATAWGAGWYYSHNFNQRLLIDNGDYYVLAHGDTYARQLGFAKWSLSNYTNNDTTDFDQPYLVIDGNAGDNNTNAQTGQFVRTQDGRFLIVHTTSQGRSARDVRLVHASSTDGTADVNGAVWLTSNQGTIQATMPKLALLGDYIMVTYALWDSGGTGHGLTWYSALLDSSLATVVAPAIVADVEFVDSAPLFQFKGGPNAGMVGWVSGNSSHTLSVGVARLGP
jgi:hypothetical protein